ncbi:protein of unknown function DUF464 [Gottschalkia purinilytica]|uniref:Ribosomal processing cysteine protease Prp n=1 Tax=Gottschalkia purinilytica TaxID=1503 RepID=A0A0L0WDB9_GOTPU|nr:ribosomal-processing cysteine protease Prp [Gottschalkia purinilytica]KNF09440.1 protein of unknown function DUF464 [Gottschalkia purinilytica]
MTNIKILSNKNNEIVQYIVSGHSGYGIAGEDIVCAAISILTETTLISLNKVCGIDEKDILYSIDEEKGYLNVSIPNNLDREKREKADIVLQTMIVGLEGLLEIYSKYITLEYGEV